MSETGVTVPAKEVIARALYELDPAEDQETDLDGRPVGKPYTIAWDQIAEYEAPAVNSFREDATAILAALEAAGYVVAPREPTEAMVKAAWMSQPAGPCCDWDMEELYRAMIAAQEKQG